MVIVHDFLLLQDSTKLNSVLLTVSLNQDIQSYEKKK